MKIYIRDLRLAIMVIWVCAFNPGCKDKNATPVKKDVTFFKDNGEKIFPTFQFRTAVRLLKNEGYLPLEEDYYYYVVKLDDNKESFDTLNIITKVWAIDLYSNLKSGEDTTKISILEYQLDTNKEKEQSLEYLTFIFGTFFEGDTCECFPYMRNFYCVKSIQSEKRQNSLNDTISVKFLGLMRKSY